MLDNAITVSDSTYREGHEFVDFKSKKGSYNLQSPRCAFAKISSDKIDIASVTSYLTEIILEQLPKNVQGLTLNLRAENIDGAFYHYTHGLKLHDGNCQRIAHGHRSKIHIYQNGQRSAELEAAWSLRWKDIYLASEADRIALAHIELSANATENLSADQQLFSYFAPQGRFDIAVPSNILDVVDCDSTVELLADFILRQLKQQSPDNEFKVVAFEGVAKGAIANG